MPDSSPPPWSRSPRSSRGQSTEPSNRLTDTLPRQGSPVPGLDADPPRGRRRRKAGVGEWIGRLFLVGLVVALGAGAIFAISLLGSRNNGPTKPAGPPPFFVPELAVEANAAIPGPASDIPDPDKPGAPPAETFQGWVRRMAYVTDLPERVLVAYAKATLAIRASNPSCHLTWSTLAAVGRIESKHGRYGGSTVTESGEESKPIIGPALDGTQGFLAVPDTDKGELDGDTKWDHAVGPMQFTPETWRMLGVRASGDGKAPDPQNIDDASRTAGRYLCRSGDLSVPKTWWKAVLVYNNSVDYARSVFSSADAYGKVSLTRA
ncbi:murein transglycosylase [Kutzneria viridogrisea]|uniref:Transglycosylase SLT domain-containing protein n=2 Tax=Kutzneria TaxID=43356 RepID=W5W7J4_9PSEU|nr:lytic transglycosylase domain-containing protein [Kutzneria albida]AHH94174.1 hypothetical protein KALB_800 [Kutzneria albida DSM 43870]MBA8929847.1 hypothetical protein [Kutzneria viridogrisea]